MNIIEFERQAELHEELLEAKLLGESLASRAHRASIEDDINFLEQDVAMRQANELAELFSLSREERISAAVDYMIKAVRISDFLLDPSTQHPSLGDVISVMQETDQSDYSWRQIYFPVFTDNKFILQSFGREGKDHLPFEPMYIDYAYPDDRIIYSYKPEPVSKSLAPHMSRSYPLNGALQGHFDTVETLEAICSAIDIRPNLSNDLFPAVISQKSNS